MAELSAAGMSDRGDIVVLNSGSSSLKFGVYRHVDGGELAILSGRAQGIGRESGTLEIRYESGGQLASQDHFLES